MEHPLSEPPDETTCRACYSWSPIRRAEPDDGFTWRRICPSTCDHQHHADAPWMDELPEGADPI